eukprot:1147112-Pelagomonas_calceolata.AAC.7
MQASKYTYAWASHQVCSWVTSSSNTTHPGGFSPSAGHTSPWKELPDPGLKALGQCCKEGKQAEAASGYCQKGSMPGAPGTYMRLTPKHQKTHI